MTEREIPDIQIERDRRQRDTYRDGVQETERGEGHTDRDTHIQIRGRGSDRKRKGTHTETERGWLGESEKDIEEKH